jgi:hypothetical protein
MRPKIANLFHHKGLSSKSDKKTVTTNNRLQRATKKQSEKEVGAGTAGEEEQ